MKEVYYCDWAAMADVHIVGIGLNEWTSPKFEGHTTRKLPPGVHLADNNKLYTFDKNKVTAPESLGWLAYMSLKNLSNLDNR